MNQRRIVKVFPESSGCGAWLTRVMCDDGTIWYLDDSRFSDWRQERTPPIPQPKAERDEPSLFERVFGKSHGGY